MGGYAERAAIERRLGICHAMGWSESADRLVPSLSQCNEHCEDNFVGSKRSLPAIRNGVALARQRVRAFYRPATWGRVWCPACT
jgi:hypothetical protein